MKLAIGLLLSNGFPVPVPFFLSYLYLYTRLSAGVDNAQLPSHLQITDAELIHSQDFPVDAARNDIVRTMLKSDARYLLFLDADMEHPIDLPARLLRHDVGVVTARYHMRRAPFHAVAMKHIGPGPFDCEALRRGPGLLPIDFGGAGALLIRRDVLEKMRDRDGENWFRYSKQSRPPYEFKISEDMHFYQAVRACGIQPYVDWDTECGHLAQMMITGTWNQAYVEQIEAEHQARHGRVTPAVRMSPEAAEEAMKDTVPAIGPSPAKRLADLRIIFDAATSMHDRAAALEAIRAAGGDVPSDVEVTTVFNS